MSDILVIDDLRKSFATGFIPRQKEILRGVSLAVEPGEIFGYLGPNGAGKTTTLKCLLGLVFPDSGSLTIFGQPHLSLRARQRIGYLPESPYFYDHLTAFEFLDFYARLFGLKKKERGERISGLLERVGLADAGRIPLRKFSRGMLQRAGLAQALINDPDLLFLDEPLGGLDPIGRKELRDIILEQKKRGKTVFLCSHILQDIEMICDRVAILVSGRVVSSGRLRDLVSEKILFTEIEISGVKREDLLGLGESLAGQEGRVLLKVVGEEKVEEVLALVLRSRGRVHSLLPRSLTLEDLFLDMVKAS
ncbi:MAG: multidrug ABC transporter ATP-binding protein [Candidatus Aminicenantes bacterium RBG_13_59_9]|nr:MAG: multidrug ABC transporter ATP-binding protein [Candidatus Aminicenantes bacterium RBG_13_59_9]